MKTLVYVDGFNLYYRVKNTPYKWLNIQKLIFSILDRRQHDILKIKYFTALVRSDREDQSRTARQHIYLRALRTISNLEIIYGQFKRRMVKGIYREPVSGKIKEYKKIITVKKWEEKESDVNIATHIVEDAYENRYNCAVLVSNDTDLKTPLRCIKNKNKKIVIIAPQGKIHVDLKKLSHFQKEISNDILKQCQFPKTLKDSKGSFHSPF